METATAKFTPDDQEALLWLDAWARKSNLSRREMAKLLNYDDSMLYRGLTGQLGNATHFLRAVREFRAGILRSLRPGTKFPFTETPLVLSIWDYARVTRQRQKFGFLIGNSHSGKTEPLKRFVEPGAKNDRGDDLTAAGGIYLRLPADGHLSFVLPKLIDAAGIKGYAGTTLTQRTLIRRNLTAKNFLIVDEIEQCCERTRTRGRQVAERVSTLEFFRELQDDLGLPILYVGTKQALRMLHGDNYELYVRTLNRGIEPYEIPDKPLSDDLEAFAEKIGLGPAEGIALKLQRSTLHDDKDGCLGRWLDKLLAGCDWAAARGRAVTWDDVLEAHAEMAKGKAGK